MAQSQHIQAVPSGCDAGNVYLLFHAYLKGTLPGPLGSTVCFSTASLALGPHTPTAVNPICYTLTANALPGAVLGSGQPIPIDPKYTDGMLSACLFACAASVVARVWLALHC